VLPKWRNFCINLAIDSLKGSLTSLEAGEAVREGMVSEEAVLCNAEGIDAFFPIVRGITSQEEAMKKENAYHNMVLTSEQVFRLIHTIKG
jgi:glycerate kinase